VFYLFSFLCPSCFCFNSIGGKVKVFVASINLAHLSNQQAGNLKGGNSNIQVVCRHGFIPDSIHPCERGEVDDGTDLR
jgi:hypothetical protein